MSFLQCLNIYFKVLLIFLEIPKIAFNSQHFFYFFIMFFDLWDFPGGSKDKESSCNAGDQGWSLGQKDPLKKGMAKHSSILAWRIPRTAEPGRLQSMGSQRALHDWITNIFTWICTFDNTGLLPVFASLPKFVFSDSLPAPAAIKILNLCLYIPLTSCSLSDPFFSSHLKSKSHPLTFNSVSFTSFSTTSWSQIKPQPFVENGSEIPFQ